MNTRKTVQLLRAYESQNVTFCEPDGSWPIVWERARGVQNVALNRRRLPKPAANAI